MLVDAELVKTLPSLLIVTEVLIVIKHASLLIVVGRVNCVGVGWPVTVQTEQGGGEWGEWARC